MAALSPMANANFSATASFDTIPSEIRAKIYMLLLHATKICADFPAPRNLRSRTTPTSQLPAILYVSKKIRTEAIRALFECAAVRLVYKSQRRCLIPLTNRIPEQYCVLLRSITFKRGFKRWLPDLRPLEQLQVLRVQNLDFRDKSMEVFAETSREYRHQIIAKIIVEMRTWRVGRGMQRLNPRQWSFKIIVEGRYHYTLHAPFPGRWYTPLAVAVDMTKMQLVSMAPAV